MARCPKCSYMLVLLSNRAKYKCAVCGRLYPQKEMEAKEFRDWNKKQKEIYKHGLILEEKKQKEEKKNVKRELRFLFNGKDPNKKARVKLTEEERKQRRMEYNIKHYQENRERKDLQKKLWRRKNNTHYREWKKQHRQKHLEDNRQQDRIQFWRKKQRALALSYLKNGQYSPPNAQIFPSVSTCPLSYLLEPSIGF